MPLGDKSNYTDGQEHKTEIRADGEEGRGASLDVASARRSALARSAAAKKAAATRRRHAGHRAHP